MGVNVARSPAAIAGWTSLRETISQVAAWLERWFHNSPSERRESDPCPDRIRRERERIARESHDTLFVATRFLSLEQAVLSLRHEFRFAVGVGFRIVVQGKPRALNEVVIGEIYRIIREAMVNSLRHSGATIIEVDLVYRPRVVRVAIRDNGSGFDLHAIESPRHSQSGLRCMSKRADKIGAQLLVWSRSGAGTEMEILIPACSQSDTCPAIRASLVRADSVIGRRIVGIFSARP